MNRLKEVLRDRRMTAEELAELVGMKGPAMRHYVRQNGRVPKLDLAAKIAAALDMDEVDLWGMGSDSPVNGNRRSIPIYGAVQAGFGEDITDISSPLDYQPAPHEVKGSGYGVMVSGDSMQPRLAPSDKVFVSPGHPIKARDLVVVQYKNTEGQTLAIVKQYQSANSNEIVLDSLNPALVIKLKRKDVVAIDRVVTVSFN